MEFGRVVFLGEDLEVVLGLGGLAADIFGDGQEEGAGDELDVFSG